MVGKCLNTSPPVRFSIFTHNVASNGTAAPAWGIEAGLGQPAQNFSFRPRIVDQTWVARADGCSSSTDYACISRRGGVYDASLSSSETVSATIDGWNGTIGRNNASEFDYYNDILTLDNETSIYGFPFTTDTEEDRITRNVLGIGPNSTFLQALVTNGFAPLRSWGLWTGSRSVSEPRNGLLIIGGYDQARVGADFEVFRSLDTCRACIQIRDMEWITDNDTVSLFTGNTEALQISLNPASDLMGVPQDVFETFARATDGEYNSSLNSLTWLRSSGGAPNGTLRVTLQDGYVTEIPRSELFSRPRGYNATGSLVVTDSTIDTALLQNVTNSDTIPSWGLPYLTMNYMVFDVDEGEFRLAPAIRQNFASQGGGVIEASLCEGLVDPSTTTTLPGSTSSSESSKDNGTPIGPIVGGVIGGIGAVSLLILVIFFILRRRRQEKSKHIAPGYTSTSKTQELPGGGHYHPNQYIPVPAADSPLIEMYANPPTGSQLNSIGRAEMYSPSRETKTNTYSELGSATTQAVYELPSEVRAGGDSSTSSDITTKIKVATLDESTTISSKPLNHELGANKTTTPSSLQQSSIETVQ